MEDILVGLIGVVAGLAGWIFVRGRPDRGHPLVWVTVGAAGAMLGGVLIGPLLEAFAGLPRGPLVDGVSPVTLAVALVAAGAFIWYVDRGSRHAPPMR